MIDIYSFGDSQASIILLEKLGDDKKLRAKISKMLETFSRTLNELSKIDSRIALGLAHNMFRDYKLGCGKLPSEVNTYTSNVLSARYRVWVDQMDGRKSYNKRGRK